MTAAGHRREHTSNEPARAFVPGHVTGFFSVHPHADPRKAGSRGAGLALSDGITVELHPTEETAVELNGGSTEIDAVTRTLDQLGVKARVLVETSLPVSAGFGVSGGAALGTALTANAFFGLEHTENELIGTAHTAEVEAGTGLGDVVAQARGGVPLRVEPGAPGRGTLDGISVPATRVEYVSFGNRPTGEVIGGEIEQLSQAGERALSALLKTPTLSQAMACSRTFAREADLLTPRVRETIDAVQDMGGEAAMAMLGETVFALGTGLTEAGYDPAVCEIHPAGAKLL